MWPAIWTVGPAPWPDSGEIDIYEGVNRANHNNMSLHTAEHCTMWNVRETEFSGVWAHAGDGNEARDCWAHATPYNAGCATESVEEIFGDSLNAKGGGVFVMELKRDTHIRIWFFFHHEVPPDLQSGQPVPDLWPHRVKLPQAVFPLGDNCPGKQKFWLQRLVINLTFCGEWAGTAFGTKGDCPGVGLDACKKFVQENPQAFAKAFWDLNYIRVYTPKPGSCDRRMQRMRRRAAASAPSPSASSEGVSSHGLYSSQLPPASPPGDRVTLNPRHGNGRQALAFAAPRDVPPVLHVSHSVSSSRQEEERPHIQQQILYGSGNAWPPLHQQTSYAYQFRQPQQWLQQPQQHYRQQQQHDRQQHQHYRQQLQQYQQLLQQYRQRQLHQPRQQQPFNRAGRIPRGVIQAPRPQQQQHVYAVAPGARGRIHRPSNSQQRLLKHHPLLTVAEPPPLYLEEDAYASIPSPTPSDVPPGNSPFSLSPPPSPPLPEQQRPSTLSSAVTQIGQPQQTASEGQRQWWARLLDVVARLSGQPFGKCTEKNVIYYGFDLKTYKGVVPFTWQCRMLCAADAGCFFFTHFYQEATCHLKNIEALKGRIANQPVRHL